MDARSFWQEIRSVYAVSRLEVIVSFAIFFSLGIYVAYTVINSDGIFGTLVAEQSIKVQENRSYAYTFQIINNPYIGGITTFALWAAAGLILTNIAYYIYASERSFVSLIRILKKGGKESHDLLEEASIRLTLRVLAIVSLLVSISLFIRYALPWVVTMLDGTIKTDVQNFILSVAGVWLLLSVFGYFVVVMLRFVFLKARLL